MKALAAAPLAAGLPALAASPSPPLLILVFLYGGNDGYNTFVPYTDTTYYSVRPNIAVARDSVLKITDRHGFHPSLAPMMSMWEARELALVQGIGNADATQQHFRDLEMAFTGCDGDEFSRDGWVTKALMRNASRNPDDRVSSSAALQNAGDRGPIPGIDAIAFDILDIRQSDPMGPFRGDKLGVVHLYYAQEYLAKRRFSDCAIETNDPARNAVARARDLPASTLKTRFPTDAFGEAARAAVELAAFDRTLPVIQIALDGPDGEKHHSVDCHWDQVKYHGDALKRLAEGLAAMRAGLQEIGRWNETLVATYDEFGRCPTENTDRGTHHGLATTHFVMGGRVKGGLYGEAPAVVRMHPIGGPAPVVDTRRLWTTVIERFWNRSASGVFTRRFEPLDLLRA
ncbi:MAG: DUF1501 domain-containing protein [Bacillota bacterium]